MADEILDLMAQASPPRVLAEFRAVPPPVVRGPAPVIPSNDRPNEPGATTDPAAAGVRAAAAAGVEMAYDTRNVWGVGMRWIPGEDELANLEGIRVYQEMEQRDPKVRQALRFKKLFLLSVGFKIHPRTELSQEDGQEVPLDEEAMKQARFIREAFNRMDKGNLKTWLKKALNAMRDGFSVTEKVWKILPDGEFQGMVSIGKLKTHRAESFQFTGDPHGNLSGIVQVGALMGQLPVVAQDTLPLEKFIVLSNDPNADDGVDIRGRSDLRPAWAYYRSKDYLGRAWNTYLERFGVPALYQKLPPQAQPQDVLDAIQVMRTLQQDTVACGPWDKPDPIEPLRSTAAEFLQRMEYNDKQIMAAVLIGGDMALSGPAHSTDGQGSRALAQTHFDVITKELKWWQEALQDLIEEEIIRPLIEFNFADPKPPRFLWDSLIQDDQAIMAEMLTKLITAGVVDAREEWVREKLRFPAMDEELQAKIEQEKADAAKALAALPPDGSGGNGGGGDKGAGGRGPGRPAGPRGGGPPGVKKMAQRRPSGAEAKVDFAAVKRTLDGFDQAAVKEIGAIVAKHAERYMKKAEPIIEDRDPTPIRSLTFGGEAEVRRVVQAWLEKVFEKGHVDSRKEMGRARMAAATIEGASLERLLKGKAYGLAGNLNDEIRKKANGILTTGLEKGFSNAKVQDQLAALFRDYTGDDSVADEDGEPITADRLETVVRTNFTAAYNLGRRQSMFDPDLEGFIKGVQFSAILDDRTTEVCAELDGKVFLESDAEGIERFTPPLHFNCRSVLVPVTEPEAADDPIVPITAEEKAKAESLVSDGF